MSTLATPGSASMYDQSALLSSPSRPMAMRTVPGHRQRLEALSRDFVTDAVDLGR